MCSNDEQKQIKLCVSTANEFYSLASTINPASSLYTYIVNEGFACELFLKAIAMKEHTDGKYKHLHSLKELWLDISANAQNEIQEHFFKTSHVNLTEFLDEANNAFKQGVMPSKLKALNSLYHHLRHLLKVYETIATKQNALPVQRRRMKNEEIICIDLRLPNASACGNAGTSRMRP